VCVHQVLAIAVVAAGVLTGCASESHISADDTRKLDQAGMYACTEFARSFPSSTTEQARVTFSAGVTNWSLKTDSDALKLAGEALGRTADDRYAKWETAANVFATTCKDRGWAPGSAK
jgi:hypothetical protein